MHSIFYSEANIKAFFVTSKQPLRVYFLIDYTRLMSTTIPLYSGQP